MRAFHRAREIFVPTVISIHTRMRSVRPLFSAALVYLCRGGETDACLAAFCTTETAAGATQTHQQQSL